MGPALVGDLELLVSSPVGRKRRWTTDKKQLLEAHLRHILRAGTRLEVVVVPLEAAPGRPNAVGEFAYKGVVVLNVLVIAHSGDTDSILSPCQLIRKPLEIL